jgi:hypothetical protein
LNPLFEFNVNLDVSVVSDHLMIGALEDGSSNLERPAVWKIYILLGGLGYLMKMWIMLGRLSRGVRRSLSPEEVQSYGCRKRLSTEFFGRAYV